MKRKVLLEFGFVVILIAILIIMMQDLARKTPMEEMNV